MKGMNIMKKIFSLIMVCTAFLVLAACSSSVENKQGQATKSQIETSTTTETTEVAEITETYKKALTIDSGKQDFYIDLTYAGEKYKSIAIRYETFYEGETLANFQAQGREAVEDNFNKHLDNLIPAVSAIKEMEGINVSSTVDDQFVWKLTVTLNPETVNFEELAEKGENFAFLAPAAKMSPSQLIAGFSIIGLEKVSN